MTDNPYCDQVRHVLPRLLSLFDTNTTKPSYGVGDRLHWAWKLTDFGNSTMQGAAHGLARLLDAGLLPEWLPEKTVLERIDAMFAGAEYLRRRNGSMEEAFPYESSFCVTALVAFDLLCAVELLGDRIDDQTRQRYLATVKPMIAFLCEADETHGIISNHLATGAAALFRWAKITNDAAAESRGKIVLERILSHQSEEGWYREYEGADPGYQSLCTYYLADVHEQRPDLGLLPSLQRSVEFLWHFAHPDGSFGGNYGSRNTRFYYPAGIASIAAAVPKAAALDSFMRESVANHTVVTLDTMDESALVPMFNAYCWAAALPEPEAEAVLPSLTGDKKTTHFKDAGLFIDSGPEHYTIISYHKGGVCYHYPRGGSPLINAGVVAESANGKRYSSQVYERATEFRESGGTITITADLLPIKNQMPTPYKFIVLRLLNVTLMRVRFLSEFIKRFLVKYLITGSSGAAGRNVRTIKLGTDLTIVDALEDADRMEVVDVKQPFTAIHMACAGFWQRQDEER